MSGQTSVVIAHNDLESDFIVRLLGYNRVPVTPLTRQWGDEAMLSEGTMAALAPIEHVILAEFGGHEVVQQLQAAGKRVDVLDHHLFARPEGIVDRRSELSVLEQLMIRLKLAYDEGAVPGDLSGLSAEAGRLVSANDRGFYPALAKEAQRFVREIEGGDAGDNDERVMQIVADVRDRDLALNLASESDDSNGLGLEEWIAQARRAIEESQADVERRNASGDLALFEPFPCDRSHGASAEGKGTLSPESLIIVRAPDRHRKTYLDALYRWAWRKAGWWKPGEGLMNCLVLMTRDGEEPNAPGGLSRVLFSGGSKFASLVMELVQAAGAASRFGRLNMFAGGSDGVFLEAVDQTGADSDLLSEVADELVGNVLTGARPINAYRTHFSQTFRIASDRAIDALRVQETDDQLAPTSLAFLRGERPDVSRRGRLDQEAAYFFEHVRGFLVPESADRTHRPKTIERIRSGLKCGEGEVAVSPITFEMSGLDLEVCSYQADKKGRDQPRRRLMFSIASVTFYFFFDGTFILEWMVEYDREKALELTPPTSEESANYDYRPYWQRLLDRSREGSERTIAEVLEFNAIARYCTSTFANRDKGPDGQPRALHRITLHGTNGPLGSLDYGRSVTPEGEFGAWFSALLDEVLPKVGLRGKDVCFAGTSRARVLSSVTPFGPAATVGVGRHETNVMLARLQTVDTYGTSHFSDPAFSRQELKDGLYKRFAGGSFPSYYAVTSHSFVGLFQDGGAAWNGARAGFPTRTLHDVHMSGVYRRMWVLITLYEALLQRYALEVGRRAGDSTSIEDVRSRFLRFSNSLWFETVSPEVQGRELFDLMRKQSVIPREHAIITEELQLSDEYFSQQHERRMSRFANSLGGIAFGLGAVAIIEPLVPIGNDVELWSRDWWIKAFCIAGVPVLFASAAIWSLPRVFKGKR